MTNHVLRSGLVVSAFVLAGLLSAGCAAGSTVLGAQPACARAMKPSAAATPAVDSDEWTTDQLGREVREGDVVEARFTAPGQKDVYRLVVGSTPLAVRNWAGENIRIRWAEVGDGVEGDQDFATYDDLGEGFEVQLESGCHWFEITRTDDTTGSYSFGVEKR
ncbi:hypothetical protein Aph01nite_73110 [Acrocarpospora phusangensis]|uniref:Lipoprotein n=1 Tax=Acrocarpospora phusangensis TaxID=1070424 RepID=A0A919QJJ8_9ACTN|nr:hypothetical protein [Acrocarpospora phusangensis]GIH29001.1 hypothetical protein Aph01nite_73110 [Acrocarpospora phusangensis]